MINILKILTNIGSLIASNQEKIEKHWYFILAMGILKLMDFIRDRFSRAITNKNALDFYGKILTIDASNTMYQFLIKTQSKDCVM